MFMAAVYEGRRTWLTPIFGWLERAIYRSAGIDEQSERDWRRYAVAALVFNVIGLAAVLLITAASCLFSAVAIGRGQGRKAAKLWMFLAFFLFFYAAADLARRFAYTEEHDLFRDQVRKFFDRELVPHLDRWEAQGEIDKGFWRKAYVTLLTPVILGVSVARAIVRPRLKNDEDDVAAE